MPSEVDTRLRSEYREKVIAKFRKLFKASQARTQTDYFADFNADLKKTSYYILVGNTGSLTREAAENVLDALGYSPTDIVDMLEYVPSPTTTELPQTDTLKPLGVAPTTDPNLAGEIQFKPVSRKTIPMRGIGFRKGLLFACLITAVILVFSHMFESTRVGRWSYYLTDRVLRWHAPVDMERLPIVIDISHLPGGQTSPTSRQDLIALIQAVAAQQPAAIAVDVDFSPHTDAVGHEYMIPGDQRFFADCRRIELGAVQSGTSSRPVPIYLGVGREFNQSPENWFQDSKYNGLAAATILNGDDPRRIPRWFQCEAYGEHIQLRSLSEALAENYVTIRGENLPAPSRWWAWLLCTVPSEQSSSSIRWVSGQIMSVHRIDSALSLVNLQLVSMYDDDRLTWKGMNAEDIPSQSNRMPLKDRMVLIGDTSQMDSIPIGGTSIRISGVLAHACAAYSFAVEPVFELNIMGRILLDVFFSIGLWIVIEYLRIASGKLTEQSKRSRKLYLTLAHCAILFGILLIVWVAARFCSLIWSDPFAVWGAIVLFRYGRTPKTVIRLRRALRNRISQGAAPDIGIHTQF